MDQEGENTKQEGSVDTRRQGEIIENQNEQYGQNKYMHCRREKGTDSTRTEDGEKQWSEKDAKVLKRLKVIMDEPNQKRILVKDPGRNQESRRGA